MSRRIVLVLATRNRAKADRLRGLCEGLGLELVDGTSLERAPEVDEDADSHLDNAVRKAVAWSAAHRCLAVASDGGLAIPGLGPDWSSLATRRSTGEDAGDEERARRLLRRMHHLKDDRRRAFWIEAVAVAREGALVEAWERSGLHGTIAEEYAAPSDGLGGFWVGGLWLSPSGRRHWELSSEELAAEGDPWQALAPHLRRLLRRLAG